MAEESIFYNRADELRRLSERYKELENHGVMIAVYGRRRVGKTELVKRFMKKHVRDEKLYFYVDAAERKVILDSLSKAIHDQLKETIIFSDFDDFFKYLMGKPKLLLAIDEFPRFLTVAPEFITSLQKYWDLHFKNKKMMILLVGSSIGMMQKITSSKTGALYGRATKMKISPFRYKDFRLMFKELSEEEKIIRYAVFGGTPYYTEKTKRFKNTLEAINGLVIKKDAELSEEPKTLLEYENVRIHAKYNSILQSISSGKEILKEMQDFTKIPATALPPYLTRLDSLLDLVKRNDPLLGKERLGRYKINDNFFRFWYKFIFENQSALNIGNRERVLKIIENELNTYVGRIFEDVSRELLILYNGSEIKGHALDFENIGGWWDRNRNEIDILAFNKKTRTLLIGEVKWSSKPLEEIDTLLKKAKLLNIGGKYNFLIISKAGFTKACMEKIKENNILSIDLKEMAKLYDDAH